jgi:magnesium chelatase subunit D
VIATAATSVVWRDALLAATLLAIDPAGLQGAVVRARFGPVRDRWQSYCRAALPASAPMRRLPIGTPDGRLLGGLDLAATLQAGRPIAERGLLAEVDGGLLILAMAERMTPSMAARLTAVLDSGEVALERDGLTARIPSRFGLIAYDEGDGPDETAPSALAERLAFLIDLDPLRDHQAEEERAEIGLIEEARRRLPAISCDPEILEAVCGTAMALGVASLRAPILALRAARAIAALAEHDQIEESDATLACRLVLAPRATRLPSQEADQDPAPPEPQPDDAPSAQASQPPSETDDRQEAEPSPDQALDDRILEAAKAAIPARLLSEMGLLGDGSRRKGSAGKAGAALKSGLRGRPIGARPGDPGGGARLNVIETLRAAAPWQRLRRGVSGKPGPTRVLVRRQDFRVTRFKARMETTAIFLVDASGSSALNRLAEAKGAVELLLADCYVRRDSVAVMAFRGRGATLLLPPTRSLVRAKRSLAALPGGGGTPLASGIDAAFALADAVKRRGQTPVVIILTDGQANVSRDGVGGRAKAGEDALQAAKQARLAGVAALLIDSAPRPQAQARAIAAELGARYLALPYANASLLSAAVRSTGIG